ncbi:MAG TPA: PQQ-binding-like beta-propeller repeat protein [Planctomycetota bacterium]|jgi:outer membrane protein assembly factor BamB|nr:PQQ-binding-like beta-propeller repeat protein [Planctomycetota bacterium]
MKTLLALVLFAAPAGAQSEPNWPRFRGPTGQGLSTDTALPLSWDASTRVAWKTEIPGEGWSSPIVWGDRAFVTSATEGGKGCHVFCLDAGSGKIRWDQKVFDQETGRKEGKNSYATPTPCTDGTRVYAVFGGGGAAALDFDGKLLWTNQDVKFYSRHGLGASPIVIDGLLVMPYDGSTRVDRSGGPPNNLAEERVGWQIPWDKAEIVALDGATGKRVWTGKRGMSRIAHATPIVVDGQIVSIAGDAVQGFDPKTGERLWSVYCQGEGLTPSPVAGDGLLYAASGFEKTTLRGIRLGGKGDVTASAIAWEQKKGVPTQPSLLFVKPYLYAVTEGGVASCFKADSGEIVWQERLTTAKTGFCASPLAAGGRIYVLSEAGETTVLEAGPVFKVLSRNALGEKCQASPAVSRGRLFIRTEKNLFCIAGD